MTGKRAFITVFWLAVLTVCFPVAAESRKIVLAADEWCPYNCSPADKDKPGYLVEIAQRVFGKAGFEVEYRVMPFDVAMQSVLKGKIDGAIAAESNTEKTALDVYRRTTGQKAHFANTHVMAVTQVSIYTASDTAWVFDPRDTEASFQSLGGKVGVPQGYSYVVSPTLKKLGIQVEMGGADPMARLLPMVNDGRIKAVIDDDAVIKYVAGRLGISEKLKYAGAAGVPLNCYFSFHASHEDYARMLNEGVEQMRASGELALLLQRYNLNDWQHDAVTQ